MGITGLTPAAKDAAPQDAAYDAAIAYLFARTGGSWSFGLDRMRALLSAVGDPQRRFRAVHVAGTNGKGSVVATLDALTRVGNRSVARYTSPHLIDFRERIVVNGRPVDAVAVSRWVEERTATVERLGATFFEATTAMAFDLFAAAGVDLALVEAGLGGRLDATNVLTPEVAVITSVGIDHVEYLGNTLEAIAGEKGGIFKPGVPAVIGELEPAIRDVLAEQARMRGASSARMAVQEMPLHEVRVGPEGSTCRVALNGRVATLKTPLIGRHQAQNLVTALLALEVLEGLPAVAELQQRLTRVRLPGRFHRVGKFIFDVAHNPAGAGVLARTVEDSGVARPLVVLLTILGDKDWRGMMVALAPVTAHFVLTRAPTAPASRAWDPADALAFARERGWSASLDENFDRALAGAAEQGASVLVTGSFHTVGDAMSRLQVDPLAG